MTRHAIVRLDLSTTTAEVTPDDGGKVEIYGAGITRTTAPARLAEFGWRVVPKTKEDWKPWGERGYQCGAVQQ